MEKKFLGLDYRARRAVYLALVFAGAVAVTYGWVAENEVALALSLVAEVLGVGMAAANAAPKPTPVDAAESED